MTKRKTRQRQLRRLAERRAAERRRHRRNRIIAGTLAGLLVLGAGGATAWQLIFAGGGPGEPTPGPSPTTQAVACDAAVPEAAAEEKRTFRRPPEMRLEDGVDYRARIQTSCGPVVVDLFEDRTPVTVNNFAFLAGRGFYDGLTFHRLIPGFMIQGGDPEGTGAGGPGYQFEDEILRRLSFAEPGVLAMANSGPDTNGSQFFITAGPAEHLDGLHTIFGRVLEGQEVVDTINALGTEEGTPQQLAYIERIRILEE
jgi:cyclophilin family peptidyl-prolyl cis-trans isomerase